MQIFSDSKSLILKIRINLYKYFNIKLFIYFHDWENAYFLIFLFEYLCENAHFEVGTVSAGNLLYNLIFKAIEKIKKTQTYFE